MNQSSRSVFKIHNNPFAKTSTCTPPIFPIIVVLLYLCHSVVTASSSSPPPPLPILPIPNAFQLQWQLSGMAMFFHFGINTFTDAEWGSGDTDPATFNPTKFNATQWISVAKECGFSRVILTAKHHDGFVLWPSDYTNYSVRYSKWRDGNGDVVGDLAAAAEDAGVGFGVYLSPWDRHEESYGDTVRYNEYYLAQMTELLTRYGEIKNIFVDGAKAKGGKEKEMVYLFENWFSLIHQHQPGAVIFSNAGPDVRWVGDEAGVAGSTCWSLFNKSSVEIGVSNPEYSRRGDPYGLEWVPAECDVSIRPGWFWHASELPKSARALLEVYYKSIGRNCHLLLNVPPNSSGLISTEDIKVLQEFNELRGSIFSNNLAINALVNASSTRGGVRDSYFSPYNVLKDGINTYWAPEENQSSLILYIDLQKLVSFNVLQVQEPIQMGQRVTEFHLEALNQGGVWKRVINGTTIGYQRLLLFPKLKSQHLKLVIDKSRADPLISHIGIYMDPVTIWSNIHDKTFVSNFNESQVLRSTTHNNSLSASM